MKRTIQLVTLSVAAMLTAIGCVKSVDAPPLAGPSTYAHSILMTTPNDTLTMNGVDFADITITSLSPTGQSENIPLRAQIYLGGIAMDFGTLSTKTPTTPTTIRYTAPPASALAVLAPATVTIRVTPTSNGDARAEFARELDLQLLPQGIITPYNPDLVPSFTVNPNPATVLETVAFDATASVGAASYTWDFGDGGTGTGSTPFHVYRTMGSYLVTLTVADVFGAQARTTRSVQVNQGTPPTVSFTVSPGSAGVDQTIFFNATASRPASGRSLVLFDWDFGDGSKASGLTTTHSYQSTGTYQVTLRVTDDAGTVGQATQGVSITATAGLPTVNIINSPASPIVNTQVFIDASGSRPFESTAPIVSYRIDFGDGSPDEVNDGGRFTHVYRSVGTFTVRVNATDSKGRVGTNTLNISVRQQQ